MTPSLFWRYWFFLLLIAIVCTNVQAETTPIIAVLDFKTQPTSVRAGADYMYFQLTEDCLQDITSLVKKNLKTSENVTLTKRESLYTNLNPLNAQNDLVEHLKNNPICNDTTVVVWGMVKLQGATLVQKSQSFNEGLIQDLFGTVRIEWQYYDTRFQSTFECPPILEEGLLGGGTPPKLFERLKLALANRITNAIEKKAIPLEVFRVREEVVFVNRGQNGDFEIGEIFDIYQFDASDRTDSAPPNIIGSVRITNIYRTFSKAIVIEGEMPRIGDLLKPKL